jgi:hypothetical protein
LLKVGALHPAILPGAPDEHLFARRAPRPRHLNETCAGRFSARASEESLTRGGIGATQQGSSAGCGIGSHAGQGLGPTAG